MNVASKILLAVTAAAAAAGTWYFAWHEPACLPMSELNKLSPRELDAMDKENRRLEREMNRRLPDGWRCMWLSDYPKYGYSNIRVDPTGSLECRVEMTYHRTDERGWHWFVRFQTAEALAKRAASDYNVTAGEAWFATDRHGKAVTKRGCQADDKVEWQDRLEVVALELVAKARDIGVGVR